VGLLCGSVLRIESAQPADLVAMLHSVQRDTLWVFFTLALVAVSPTANAARPLQGAAHNASASADNVPTNIAFNFSTYGGEYLCLPTFGTTNSAEGPRMRGLSDLNQDYCSQHRSVMSPGLLVH